MHNIYNSSGKIVGELTEQDDKIVIHMTKHSWFLSILISELKGCLFSKQYNEEVILKLYDEYTLPIGAIAAIFDVHYHMANKWIEKSPTVSKKKSGRRNSSYGVNFPDSRIKKIRDKSLGRKIYNNGKNERFFRQGELIPEGFKPGRLPFSESTKEKLKTEIHKMQELGIMKKGKEAAQLGWKNGKFEGVDFKRGIGGWITSKKIKKRFFFRSLLELKYILMIESDEDIFTYEYEPFIIQCDDGSCYTPDLLINNNLVVELKSYKFVYRQGGKIQERFEYKVQQAEKYCKKNELEYKVIYDKDIQFDSKAFKHELLNSNFISEYDIVFAQPERIWSKK